MADGTPQANSPASGSLTPMELDVNAAPGDQQQQMQTPTGSTEFQSPTQALLSQTRSPAIQQQQTIPPQPVQPQQQQSTPTIPESTQVDSRLDADYNRREKTLAEFLAMMDQYTPIIPDAVTDYYLERTGFDCDDLRIKRLLALATQKFVADIATDAYQYCKVRQSGNRKSGKDRKAVLTMEDLSAALAEYGVNVKKPDFYS